MTPTTTTAPTQRERAWRQTITRRRNCEWDTPTWVSMLECCVVVGQCPGQWWVCLGFIWHCHVTRTPLLPTVLCVSIQACLWRASQLRRSGNSVRAMVFRRRCSGDGIRATVFRRWCSGDGVQAMAFGRRCFGNGQWFGVGATMTAFARRHNSQ